MGKAAIIAFSIAGIAIIIGAIMVAAPNVQARLTEITKKPMTAEEQEAYDLQVAKEIHNLVNEKRAELGFAPLAWNEKAAINAREWSKYMYETGNYYHSKSYADVCKDENNPYGIAGQNLNKVVGGPVTAENTVDSWMGSSGHKANILSRWFVSEGIGVYHGYATQNFC